MLGDARGCSRPHFRLDLIAAKWTNLHKELAPPRLLLLLLLLEGDDAAHLHIGSRLMTEMSFGHRKEDTIITIIIIRII